MKEKLVSGEFLSGRVLSVFCFQSFLGTTTHKQWVLFFFCCSVQCRSLQRIISLFYPSKNLLAPNSERWRWFPSSTFIASHLKLSNSHALSFKQHLRVQALRRWWLHRTLDGILRTIDVFQSVATAWASDALRQYTALEGLGWREDGKRKIPDVHSKIWKAILRSDRDGPWFYL